MIPRLLLAALLCAPIAAAAQGTKGTALDPTPDNLARTWNAAWVVLPAPQAGGTRWQGRLTDLPSTIGRGPVAVLMHGSSGIAAFVKDYQAWLADELSLASIAPDSMAIPDRLTYTSPIDVATYERVHALRLAELRHALEHAAALSWVDPRRIIVIGSSEGSVPVARYAGAEPLARIIYSWSCEMNYFVASPGTAIPQATLVLNVIASQDPYFSPLNPWNAGYAVTGSCATALRAHPNAMTVVVSSTQHTIMNMPAVRDVAAGFLRRILAGR